MKTDTQQQDGGAVASKDGLSRRDEREIIVGSRRVEICHEDGMWAAYVGCSRNDVNDDDFYGWYESGQSVLDSISALLRDATYWRVAAIVTEMEEA